MVRTFLFGLSVIAFIAPAHAASWTGKASFYDAHRRVASGKAGILTAAHRSLPFGTQLRVINLANQRAVVVRVNDRGPFVRGRIVDVSLQAANILGMRQSGVVPVRVERLVD